MKKICVSGMTIKYSILGVEVSGVEVISTLPSTDTFIDNKGIYAGTFTVTLSGVEYPSGSGFIQVTPAVFNIQPSSQNNFDNNNPCLLEGDNATVYAVTFTNEYSGVSTTYDIKCEITNAGQDSVEGD